MHDDPDPRTCLRTCLVWLGGFAITLAIWALAFWVVAFYRGHR